MIQVCMKCCIFANEKNKVKDEKIAIYYSFCVVM